MKLHKSTSIKQKAVESLFRHQMNRLIELGCPKQIISILSGQIDSVCDGIAETKILAGHIPFLAVIPTTYRSIYDQMESAFPNGHIGNTDIDPTGIIDNEKTPNEPYFILDVDLGSSLLGKSPTQALRLIRRCKRYPLTVAEVISIGILVKPSPVHNLDANGSQYRRGNIHWRNDGKTYFGLRRKIIVLCNILRNPNLGWHFARTGHPQFASPSCQHRLGDT